MSTTVGRSLNVVNNFFRLDENYGKIERSGRKQRLSKRHKRSIMRLVASKSMFASEVKHELDLPVGIRRIQQVLQFSEYLKYAKGQRKPHLTEKRIQTELGQKICFIYKLE